MATYRIYDLDAQGHILGRSDADCADDADACVQATAALGTDGEAEVWSDRRLVGRVRGSGLS